MRAEGIFGPAGTGKSYLLKQRLLDDRKYAKLTATTGVAAMNLGSHVTTIHSSLGFHNHNSLEENQARVINNFVRMAYSYKGVVIDEISMFPANTLQLLFECYQQAVDVMTEARGTPSEFGLILTGDFCQIPPVEGKFAFQAKCWEHFEPNITRLTHNYRQTDPKFAEALWMARQGKGISTAKALVDCGARFISEPRLGFDGVTLFPTNVSVDKFNRESYELLNTEEFSFPAIKWGRQMSEWKMIPDVLILKMNSKVMALANRRAKNGELGQQLVYANGSVGEITGIDDEATEPSFIVKFPKSGWEGTVEYIERTHQIKNPPIDIPRLLYQGPPAPQVSRNSEKMEDQMEWITYLDYMHEYVEKAKRENKAYFDPEEKKWTVGSIRYIPLQMAYALSFHKAQGLTLDAVQIDARSDWAGKPGMMYVAMSRVTTPTGLVVVGTPTQLAKRILTSPEVKHWI
jgi:ATP-dependent DNA helicase PIF1